MQRDNSRAVQQFLPFIKGATRKNTTYNKIHKASHTYINIHTFVMRFAQEMHNNTTSYMYTCHKLHVLSYAEYIALYIHDVLLFHSTNNCTILLKS